MQGRISVVAWDCRSLRVLPECYVEGAYGYQATSPKEQSVQLTDADEVSATLPLSGARLAGQFDNDFASGTSLDLALVMIGKRTTPRTSITRDDLRGNCAGASHVVKSATLGAFTLATGERARVRSVADLFGAQVALKSQSGKSTFLRDGSLDACNSAQGAAGAPPIGCNAVLRLELLPLEMPEPPITLIAEETAAGIRGKFCPNIADCEQRCDAREGAACNALMVVYAIGDRVPRDLGRASALAKRACDLDDMNACTLLGISLITEGPYANVDRGLAYLQHACDRGTPGACSALASSRHNAGNQPEADYYAKRACELGSKSDCR